MKNTTSQTKNETATTTLRDLRHPAGTKTIGDTIDKLAEAYSNEGDHTGLFILQEALTKATELRSMQQRFDEANEMFAAYKKTQQKAGAIPLSALDHAHLLSE